MILIFTDCSKIEDFKFFPFHHLFFQPVMLASLTYLSVKVVVKIKIKIKIKITLLSCITRNYSSAFDPSTLAPFFFFFNLYLTRQIVKKWFSLDLETVEHTLAQGHTHGDRCHTLEQWAGITAPGEHGGTVGTSAVARRRTATPPAVSPPIFLSGESGNKTFRLLDDPLSHGRPMAITSWGFNFRKKKTRSKVWQRNL